jgi:hypothetical protein
MITTQICCHSSSTCDYDYVIKASIFPAMTLKQDKDKRPNQSITYSSKFILTIMNSNKRNLILSRPSRWLGVMKKSYGTLLKWNKIKRFTKTSFYAPSIRSCWKTSVMKKIFWEKHDKTIIHTEKLSSEEVDKGKGSSRTLLSYMSRSKCCYQWKLWW